MVGVAAARKVLGGLLASGYEIIPVDESLLRTAQKYFERQKSWRETMFDCVNMAVAEVYEVEAIFSFDKGYKKNGFKLLE
jgi:predicted nucleic acid-binding protein